MENFLMEKANLKVAFAPVDLNTAAVTGARVSLAQGDRISIVVNMGTSTAAVTNFTLQQHNAASGGTSKALSIANAYYHKAGVATSFTKVEPSSAASAFDLSSVFAADGGIVVFEVLAEDLDVSNNFSHISLNVDDSTAAKLGTAVYQLRKTRFAPSYDQAL